MKTYDYLNVLVNNRNEEDLHFLLGKVHKKEQRLKYQCVKSAKQRFFNISPFLAKLLFTG